MPAHSSRRHARAIDIWPGFVDALATLIMVIVFLLMIFTLFQFYLKDMISGRDQAVSWLNEQLGQLAEVLAVEQRTGADLRTQLAQLSAELGATLGQRDELEAALRATRGDRDRLQQAVTDLGLDRDRLQLALAQLGTDRDRLQQALTQLGTDRDRLQQALAQLGAERDRTQASLRQTEADRERLQAALNAAGVDRDKLQAALALAGLDRDKLAAALREATTQREASQIQANRVAKELEDAFKTISADRQKIEVQLRELDSLRREIETLTILRRELEAKLNEQGRDLQRDRTALAEERKLTEDARTRLDLLTRQLNALREQITRLNAALDASESKSKDQQTQIVDLGRRLNLALASRVEELARYRSEFFGRLREALGNRQEIRVVGDRFVFQSEVLFTAGAAVLEQDGQAQLAQLAIAIKDVAQRIPPDLNWVLQINGHTDRRPINTPQFPSNWELSAARAISVVKYLESQGIPSDRLLAAGFAEFQPLDTREDEIGFRRNRRIEIKLTNR